MTFGTSELIAVISLFVAFVAWVNSNFTAIDKRFDKVKDDTNKRFDTIDKDINGLGSRVSIVDEGTCELLGEQINQLKSRLFDLEKRLNNFKGD
jgi:tetrahydromethanopterin S-methyltransferase subunit G